MKNRHRTLDEFLHRHGTGSQLARKLGVSPSHISDIRHGRKIPSAELAAQIERETGVPATSLRKGRR